MENQSCYNCKFFVHYYVKRLTVLEPVNYGYCRNNYLSVKKKKDYPFKNGCEMWESAEGKEERRKEEIESIIRKMQNHLEQIAILLKNKNEP